jgi:hypothetical protein
LEGATGTFNEGFNPHLLRVYYENAYAFFYFARRRKVMGAKHTTTIRRWGIHT